VDFWGMRLNIKLLADDVEEYVKLAAETSDIR
jgi:hypothetical protein